MSSLHVNAIFTDTKCVHTHTYIHIHIHAYEVSLFHLFDDILMTCSIFNNIQLLSVIQVHRFKGTDIIGIYWVGRRGKYAFIVICVCMYWNIIQRILNSGSRKHSSLIKDSVSFIWTKLKVKERQTNQEVLPVGTTSCDISSPVSWTRQN